MNEELAKLAASGATALVSAMGTDLWQEAKRLMTGVLAHAAHDGRRKELSAALDRAPTAGRGAVDARAVGYWTEALIQLLDRYPALAQDVKALTSLRIPEPPGAAIQFNSATESGEVFAVQHGTQHIVSGRNPRDSEQRP